LLIEKAISETSRLRQIVVITAISKRIDFETELDWNENRQFLVSPVASNKFNSQICCIMSLIVVAWFVESRVCLEHLD
jgi:hypothetical protein